MGEQSELHTGVFNRDFSIYFLYVGTSVMSKNAQAELCGPNTSMLEVRFEQLKPTYDTVVIHFDYTLEQL